MATGSGERELRRRERRGGCGGTSPGIFPGKSRPGLLLPPRPAPARRPLAAKGREEEPIRGRGRRRRPGSPGCPLAGQLPRHQPAARDPPRGREQENDARPTKRPAEGGERPAGPARLASSSGTCRGAGTAQAGGWRCWLLDSFPGGALPITAPAGPGGQPPGRTPTRPPAATLASFARQPCQPSPGHGSGERGTTTLARVFPHRPRSDPGTEKFCPPSPAHPLASPPASRSPSFTFHSCNCRGQAEKHHKIQGHGRPKHDAGERGLEADQKKLVPRGTRFSSFPVAWLNSYTHRGGQISATTPLWIARSSAWVRVCVRACVCASVCRYVRVAVCVRVCVYGV